jgi:hypothetical protein
MIHVTDELIMAYADGELGETEANAVRDAAASDRALAARIESIKALNETIRRAFGVPAGSTVQARTAELLQSGARLGPVLVSQNIRLARRAWMAPFGGAIAAGIAGLFVGNIYGLGTPSSWVRPVDDGIALTGAVETAVSNTPSGMSVVADGVHVAPILSFVGNDGRKCREISLRTEVLAGRALVCRDVGEKEWCLEAFSKVPVLKPQAGAFHAAGVPRDPVMDAAYARIQVKSMLDEEAERSAIARKWAD